MGTSTIYCIRRQRAGWRVEILISNSHFIRARSSGASPGYSTGSASQLWRNFHHRYHSVHHFAVQPPVIPHTRNDSMSLWELCNHLRGKLPSTLLSHRPLSPPPSSLTNLLTNPSNSLTTSSGISAARFPWMCSTLQSSIPGPLRTISHASLNLFRLR